MTKEREKLNKELGKLICDCGVYDDGECPRLNRVNDWIQKTHIPKAEVEEGIGKLEREFFPAEGCDNCWGDLNRGCTIRCLAERKKGSEFILRAKTHLNLDTPKE